MMKTMNALTLAALTTLFAAQAGAQSFTISHDMSARTERLGIVRQLTHEGAQSTRYDYGNGPLSLSLMRRYEHKPDIFEGTYKVLDGPLMVKLGANGTTTQTQKGTSFNPGVFTTLAVPHGSIGLFAQSNLDGEKPENQFTVEYFSAEKEDVQGIDKLEGNINFGQSGNVKSLNRHNFSNDVYGGIGVTEGKTVAYAGAGSDFSKNLQYIGMLRTNMTPTLEAGLVTVGSDFDNGDYRLWNQVALGSGINEKIYSIPVATLGQEEFVHGAGAFPLKLANITRKAENGAVLRVNTQRTNGIDHGYVVAGGARTFDGLSLGLAAGPDFKAATTDVRVDGHVSYTLPLGVKATVEGWYSGAQQQAGAWLQLNKTL